MPESGDGSGAAVSGPDECGRRRGRAKTFLGRRDIIQVLVVALQTAMTRDVREPARAREPASSWANMAGSSGLELDLSGSGQPEILGFKLELISAIYF